MLGRETLYNRAYGDLKVIAIDEQRYVDTYTSELRSYYAPRFRFPVFWTYKDANESRIECTLANMRQPTATITAAPQPAPQPAATPAVKAAPIEAMQQQMVVIRLGMGALGLVPIQCLRRHLIITVGTFSLFWT